MSKYKAIRTQVGDLWFDSKKEANRWCELLIAERAGLIRDLKRQVPFVLCAWSVKENCAVTVGTYRADFVYQDTRTGQTCIEDVKGMKTPLYRFKKKLFEAQYGLRITET